VVLVWRDVKPAAVAERVRRKRSYIANDTSRGNEHAQFSTSISSFAVLSSASLFEPRNEDVRSRFEEEPCAF
jgi:hypothetical protein